MRKVKHNVETAVRVLIAHVVDDELSPETAHARDFLIKWLGKRQATREAEAAYWQKHREEWDRAMEGTR